MGLEIGETSESLVMGKQSCAYVGGSLTYRKYIRAESNFRWFWDWGEQG